MESEWHKIISFNGSQANAFEELVCQVAMSEEHPEFKMYERVGTPDGGVECYWQLADNTEWGWQAKYYSNLESAEWNNIRQSLFSAVETHPQLTRYFICLPHNLSDGRRGKKTQKATWDQYRETWIKDLSQKGREIDLVLWNSSTLFSKLILLKNSGIKSFFWGEIDINESQLFLHLDAAIENLGPKYSPELNFKLDYLPSVFDALSRNKRFQKSFKKELALYLLKLNEVISNCNRFEETKTYNDLLLKKCQEFIQIYERTNFLLPYEIPINAFITVIEEIKIIIKSLKDALREIELKYQEEIRKKATATNRNESRDYLHQSKTDSETIKIYDYENISENLQKYLSGPILRSANEGVIFLKGKPGTGKSHLMADIALERKSNGIPSIFLLGEHFSNQSPKIYIQQLLCPTRQLEDYLRALEALAKTKQTRILFIIDAINEGAGKFIWKTNISGLLKELKQFKWIGFAFSYRSTYEEIVIPENFNQPVITHNGFEGIEYEATKSFFAFYKIQQPTIPILNPEFTNPLFLKTFCITLNKSGKTTIPEGYEGISRILEEYIDAVNKNVGTRLEYPHRKINLVEKAVNQLIQHQIDTEDYIISWENAFQLTEPILRVYSNKAGFLEELIKEGLLIEDYFYNRKSNKYEQHGVVFNYERFNEHLKAMYLLGKYSNTNSVIKAFTSTGKLRRLFIDRLGYTGSNAGLLNAFSIILPEKFNVEIYEVFKVREEYAAGQIYQAFLQSIIWRRHDTIKNGSWGYLKKYLKTGNDEEIIDFYSTILLVAANPLNFYNGNFIHSLLKDRSVAERDFNWSLLIDKMWRWNDKNAVRRLIDWCWSEEDKSYTKDESIVLLGKVLAWLFTNSNRYIRDKATKAFASLFINKVHLLKEIVEEFKNINDPYVLERVAGAAFGAISHSADQDRNVYFAQYIYDEFFKNRKPPLNVLTRDYCKGIIEFVVSKGGHIDHEKNNLYPPFDYPFPADFPDEKWVDGLRVNKEGKYTDEEIGRSQIFSSVLSWDFARYILGTDHSRSVPFVCYSIKSKESFTKLKNKLRGIKRDHFKMYVESETMFNNTSELGKKIRKVFSGTELEDQLKSLQEFVIYSKKLLKEKLSQEDWRLFEDAQEYINNGFETSRYDRKTFPVKLVQHYILKKVFDLGWTMEYFGKYDAGVDNRSRRAEKAERIGKKYQWIAYYEIMALLSDNYDYSDRYSDEDIPFIGTWQHNFRNIDPTAIIKQIRHEDEPINWWLKDLYSNWNEDRKTWLKRFDDMPDFQKIINFTNEEGIQFYLLYDRVVWRSQKPIGKDRYKSERKELWIDVNAFIVDKRSKSSLMKNSSGKLLWLKDNTPENPSYYDVYLAEFYQLDAYTKQMNDHVEKYPFNSFTLGVKNVDVILTVEEYAFQSEYDLSEQKIRLYKPSKFLFELLDAETGKNDACIYDKSGNVIAYDYGAYNLKPERCFLIRKDIIERYLKERDLELIWFFCGEKEDLGSNISYVHRMLFSGFLAYGNGKFQISYHHQQER
jgi:hypothetical protein